MLQNKRKQNGFNPFFKRYNMYTLRENKIRKDITDKEDV